MNTEIHCVSGVSQTRKARRTAVAAPVMGSERRNGLHGAFPRPESVEYFHHSGYGPAADGAGLPHQLPPARCAGALVPARHARVRAPRVHAHRALVERWRACAATASTNGGASSRGFLRIADAIMHCARSEFRVRVHAPRRCSQQGQTQLPPHVQVPVRPTTINTSMRTIVTRVRTAVAATAASCARATSASRATAVACASTACRVASIARSADRTTGMCACVGNIGANSL